jgi:CheY-like chemotaxis protein
MSLKQALVVDDEPANQDFLVRLIAQAGFEVHGASNGQEALKIAEGHPNLLVAVVDLQLPDVQNLELVMQLRAMLPDCILLVATVIDDPNQITKAFEHGCDVFLVKPHGFMEFYRRLQGVPEQREQLSRLLIDQYGPRPYLD